MRESKREGERARHREVGRDRVCGVCVKEKERDERKEKKRREGGTESEKEWGVKRGNREKELKK